MALPATAVWEVRPTNGSDTNGGGFVSGGTGTDWSQQNTAQYSVTDAVTNGTTTITSATAAFGTDVVDNILYIQGGTAGITAGWYRITSRTNSTTIVVDRSTGLTAGTGATLRIGGALKTLTQAWASAVAATAGMSFYVKAETTITLTSGLTAPSVTTQTTGYTTTRGDNGRVTLQLSGTPLTAITVGTQFGLANFVVDGNSQTSSIGIDATQTMGLSNVTVKNCTSKGINSTIAIMMEGCEVTNCSGTTAAVETSTSVIAHRCWIHGNTKSGIKGAASTAVIDSIIANNSGASSDGIEVSAGGVQMVTGCVLYNNGRDGVRFSGTATQTVGDMVVDCIIAKNGAFGINLTTAGPPGRAASGDLMLAHHNAFWSNTSGATQNLTQDSTSLTLTGDPFNGGSGNTTDGSSNDFTLNNTAGAGADCRNVRSIGTFPTITGTGYGDIGVFRHQDPAGSAGMLFVPNLEGT